MLKNINYDYDVSEYPSFEEIIQIEINSIENSLKKSIQSCKSPNKILIEKMLECDLIFLISHYDKDKYYWKYSNDKASYIDFKLPFDRFKFITRHVLESRSKKTTYPFQLDKICIFNKMPTGNIMCILGISFWRSLKEPPTFESFIFEFNDTGKIKIHFSSLQSEMSKDNMNQTIYKSINVTSLLLSLLVNGEKINVIRTNSSTNISRRTNNTETPTSIPNNDSPYTFIDVESEMIKRYPYNYIYKNSFRKNKPSEYQIDVEGHYFNRNGQRYWRSSHIRNKDKPRNPKPKIRIIKNKTV